MTAALEVYEYFVIIILYKGRLPVTLVSALTQALVYVSDWLVKGIFRHGCRKKRPLSPDGELDAVPVIRLITNRISITYRFLAKYDRINIWFEA